MHLNFRHGIIRCQTDTGIADFLRWNNSNIGLYTENSPTVLTIAHKSQNYLHTEHTTVPNAFIGPFDLDTNYWLWIELDPVSGARTFKVTTYGFTYSNVEPDSPVMNQHWFDPSDTVMKVHNGIRWVEKIKILVGTVISGTIRSFNGSTTYIGSQVGLNIKSQAGAIVLDSNDKPILRFDKTFMTTSSLISSTLSTTSMLRMENIGFYGIASAPLAAMTVVKLDFSGRLLPANNVDLNTTLCGIIEEDITTGEVVRVALSGVFSKDGWSWTTPGYSIYIDSTGTGSITETSYIGANKIGYIVDSTTLVLNFNAGVGGSGGDSSAKGDKGQRGQKGEIGSTGLNGTDGLNGAKGDTGQKGQKGDTGDQGDVGIKGDTGNTGLTGDTGAKGQKGEIGDTGAKGEIGLTGDTGPTGSIGAKGQKGDTGDKGEIGVKGDVGEKGQSGDKGIDGTNGVDGINGSKGQKGDTGDIGLTGSTGLKGDTGPQGPQGEIGPIGLTGVKGSEGAKGQKGEIGVGTTGLTGDKGDKGDTSAIILNDLRAVPVTIGGILAGRTFVDVPLDQVVTDLLYPYQKPNFNTFNISEMSDVEVGYTYVGDDKDVSWTITNVGNITPNTIVIRDDTSANVLANNIPNASPTVISFPIKTRNTAGTNVWSISTTNTDSSISSATFAIEWKWATYYGESAQTSLTGFEVNSLRIKTLSSTANQTLSYLGGNYKYFAYPTLMGQRTVFKDSLTGLPVQMESPYTVSVTNQYGVTATYYVHRTSNKLGSSITIISSN